MAVVAVPVFRSRVAPAFDSCLSVLLIHMAHDGEVERRRISLSHLSAPERVAVMQREGVAILICGGISEPLRKMLESSGVHVITGIVGEVEEVLSAFMFHRLDDPKFCMPGRGGRSSSRHEEARKVTLHNNKGGTQWQNLLKI